MADTLSDRVAYALDSTIIDLCLSLFPWADFRTTKAALKMHTLLDLRCHTELHPPQRRQTARCTGPGPARTRGRSHLRHESGYLDFARLSTLHQSGAFFVTRAKRNMRHHRVYSGQLDNATGLVCDPTITLDGFYSQRDYPEHLRRIRFKDPTTGNA